MRDTKGLLYAAIKYILDNWADFFYSSKTIRDTAVGFSKIHNTDPEHSMMTVHNVIKKEYETLLEEYSNDILDKAKGKT